MSQLREGHDPRKELVPGERLVAPFMAGAVCRASRKDLAAPKARLEITPPSGPSG
jgi:hypothetical protein